MVPGPDGPQTFLVGFELFGVLEIKDRTIACKESLLYRLLYHSSIMRNKTQIRKRA